MNYEQKYNELVNAIKVLQETNPSDEGIQNWVNDNVPELRESEDESTRKRIIALVNSHGQGRFKETMIAWLEKQGRKSAEWKQENREELTEFENVMMHIGDSFFGENAGLDPNDTDTIKEQAELLLELAPKTEWSEEDEEMLRSITATCELAEQDRDSSPARHLLEMQLDWLKSIKDRYTWKPSKEQMDAMQMAVSYFGYSWVSKEQKLLESLYKDLKKLTEG